MMLAGLGAMPLRRKLLLASVLVEVTMLALLVGNGVRLVHQHLEHQTKARIESMALAYKTALALPLASRDYATLRDILDGWRKAEDIEYLAVSDPQGKLLAVSGWTAEQPPPPGHDRGGAPVQHIRLVVDYLGQTYGHLHYGLSTRFIAVAKRELLTQSLAIAAVEVLLTVLLLSALGYWLTRHLSALTAASARVAEGDYRIRLDTGSRDEVAQLADNFNTMAREIEARIAALSESEMRFRAIADYTYDWENWFTPDGIATWINPAVERITGYDIAECRAMDDFPACLAYADDRGLVRRCHQLGLAGQTGRDEEFRIHRKDGRIVWVAMSWQPIFDAAGRPLGYRSSIRDISLEHYAREELAYQASHDALTGLYNRRAFETRLREALEERARDPGVAYCLLYIDLDQFKLVNDTCGHSAGDTLLQEVTAIMRKHLNRGYLARLGGDEFGLLLPGDSEEAVRMGEKLIDLIHAHIFEHDRRIFRLGASVGVVAIGDAGQTLDAWLIAADQACYAAKDRGRNRVEVYALEDAYYQSQRAQLLSVADLHHALEANRFELHYQRIQPLKPGLPEHVEILLRLRAEDGRLIPPGVFIPAAERFGLMPLVDRWVLERVCAELGDAQTGPVVGINLSGATLGDRNLPEQVRDCLARHGVAPHRVCFEITETAAVGDLEQARTFIERVQALGASVALDDFGAGLASFAYLRGLGVDFLKIDGLFVRELDVDAKDRAVVLAIIEVARVNGMTTIAEYAHRPAIVEVLRELGVDYVQGYAIHEPERYVA